MLPLTKITTAFGMEMAISMDIFGKTLTMLDLLSLLTKPPMKYSREGVLTFIINSSTKTEVSDFPFNAKHKNTNNQPFSNEPVL